MRQKAAAVAMHTALHLDHPEVGCVLHAHPRYATVFAVANREIECRVEAMAMFDPADGVPVAAYGPRGSDEAVPNIRAAVRPGVPAVLLADHGLRRRRHADCLIGPDLTPYSAGGGALQARAGRVLPGHGHTWSLAWVAGFSRKSAAET